MALLQRPEVLLMFEDVMVYGFQQLRLPYIQDEDPNARRLFTPSIGAAVLRFRCANERAYLTNVRKETVNRLLEQSARRIGEFARTSVHNIFHNGEPNYMRFFRYLALILDLTVFAHRYKKGYLMNTVVVECGNVFDAFLAMEEELPFWSRFMALCDIVLRNSSDRGRPDRLFRNPAVHWDPRHPAFNPDNPALFWDIPLLNLDPDHPILNPDRQALMNKIRRERAAASRRAAENSDEDDESCSLGVESLNIGSANSRGGADNSRGGADNSSIRTGTENLNVSTVNLGHDENLNRNVASSSTGAENLNSDENSNSRNDNSHHGAENSDLHALNSDPHPFDVIISAMCYSIHNIDLNPVPEDPSLD